MQNNSNESRGAVVPYIAVLTGLLLCAGILGWFISSRNVPAPETKEPEVRVPSSASERKVREAAQQPAVLPDIAAVYEGDAYDSVQSTVSVVSDIPAEESVETASLISSIQLMRPAGGEIIYDYSDNLPAYNETMRDWRVHNAVDIAAAPGEIAVAAANGTVDAIYEDRLLGNVIVLSHDGGYKTLYANLSTHTLVSEGDTVTKGDPLCEIGGTAVMELFLPEHLHFALLKNDIPVNPMDFWEE